MNNIKRIIESTIKEYLKENSELLNKNFWDWFGNSVVKNVNGPIICYHGTDMSFSKFSKETIGSNHFESKSDVYGGGFFFVDKEKYAHGGGIIKEVYLKIETPYLIELKDGYGKVVDYYDAVDNFDLSSKQYFEIAKENGNDGIIVSTTKGSLYVVFEPNQIKSVENDGTWDDNDEDIYS